MAAGAEESASGCELASGKGAAVCSGRGCFTGELDVSESDSAKAAISLNGTNAS